MASNVSAASTNPQRSVLRSGCGLANLRPKAARVSKRRSRNIGSRISLPGPSGGARRELGATMVGAVVVTVAVSVTDPDAAGADDAGLTAQVASEGAPVQVKLMVWLMPPTPPRLSEYVAI